MRNPNKPVKLKPREDGVEDGVEVEVEVEREFEFEFEFEFELGREERFFEFDRESAGLESAGRERWGAVLP